MVLSQVKREYVGYTVIDTLTSALGKKSASCTGGLQLWAKETEAEAFNA